MLQFWNMFNAKGFGTTTPIWKAVGGCAPFFGVLLLILAGQFIIVTWGGNVFRTVPLSGCDWLTIIGATSLVMWGRRVDPRAEFPPQAHNEIDRDSRRASYPTPAHPGNRRANHDFPEAVRTPLR